MRVLRCEEKSGGTGNGLFIVYDDHTEETVAFVLEREAAEMLTFSPALIEAAAKVVEDARAVIAWDSIDKLAEELEKIGGGS